MLAALVAASLTAGVAAASLAGAPQTIGEKIDKARKRTWHWQRVMHRRRTPLRNVSSQSTGYELWVLRRWRERADKWYAAAHHPPHERQFRCIHRHEGSWTANTGNGYYGGLQMDIAFQHAYGRRLLRRKGPAHGWTPLEQIWVGERALRAGRGFYPWPVAARRCGLI